MKKALAITLVLSFFLLVACSSSNKREKEFVMREVSEMSQLMRKIVATHTHWKQQLEKGDFNLIPYSDDMILLPEATLSEGFYKDERFNMLATEFLQTIEKASLASNLEESKKWYSASVSVCMDCHTDYCSGVNATIADFKLEE